MDFRIDDNSDAIFFLLAIEKIDIEKASMLSDFLFDNKIGFKLITPKSMDNSDFLYKIRQNTKNADRNNEESVIDLLKQCNFE